ncbi:MAG: hypothetical protein WBB76_12770 [Gaiellaceae bacterium]
MGGSLKRKVVAGTAAALAVGGAGAGIAATRLGSSPSQENKAVVDDAAKQLGVQPSALSSALKKALENRVDAAVAAGRITKAEGDQLKQRIESENVPFFGPMLGFGHFGLHRLGGLSAAASYLKVTESQLDSKLDSGKTLAQIAKDEGKSVDGLVAAMKNDLKTKLDQAVSAGRLTKTQADQILSDSDQRITDLVNGKLMRPPGREGFFRNAPGPDGGQHEAFPGGM